jgi:hypothetical protein
MSPRLSDPNEHSRETEILPKGVKLVAIGEALLGEVWARLQTLDAQDRMRSFRDRAGLIAPGMVHGDRGRVP